jgi:hypothetical protein
MSTSHTYKPNANSSVVYAMPDSAPVRRSAIGPALNERACYVGRDERNLYVWPSTLQRQLRVIPENRRLFQHAS